MMPTKYTTTMVTLVVLGLLRTAGAAEPESTRFDDDEFRRRLLELNLVDLLEYHLEDNPPEEDLSVLLMKRQMKLAAYRDPATGDARRRQSLDEANQLLESIIKNHSTDSRVVEWQLQLARSLIYEQAEPLYSSILYRGGTPASRQNLLSIMTRAVAGLADLTGHLQTEYARLDEISVRQYERLEDEGYVARLESALPESEYMLRWAKFYKALALDDASADRRQLLSGVLVELRDESDLLTTDHAYSHVQAQSLLLAGMCARRLDDPGSAGRYLREAANVARGVPDAQERQDLKWITVLAPIERIRALADANEFVAATESLSELMRWASREQPEDFGVRIVLALLESDIRMAQAAHAERGGNKAIAATIARDAYKPLRELAESSPANRDQIYALLYDRFAGRDDVVNLQPFEKCAVIAGRISEAAELRSLDPSGGDLANDAEAARLLDEAISLSKSLIATGGQSDLVCEARFNLGVAHFHRGQRLEAIAELTTTAEDCPQFARAPAAASYAVDIAAELAEEPAMRIRSDIHDAYLRALTALVHGFPQSESAEYWRFFLAQALDESGRFDDAAREYAAVDRNHASYLTALFRHARCQVLSLSQFTLVHDDQKAETVRRANDASRALDRFRQETVSRAGDASAPRDLSQMLAQAEVLAAEMDVLPGVEKYDAALSTLEGFEERYPDESALLGRVLRARIISYEATGRLDEARRAVPEYMASAPAEAGVTLQSLFDAASLEIRRLRKAGREDDAQAKAAGALLFAEQLERWATRPNANVPPTQLHAIRVQLAEAYLQAGRFDEAHDRFRQLMEAAGGGAESLNDPRAAMGYAETLYQLGRFEPALPLFNQLFQVLPKDDPDRFRALLRDLQCRTQLGEDPNGIVNVIKQHRYLSPDLGGEELKAEFAKLLEENERRAARK